MPVDVSFLKMRPEIHPVLLPVLMGFLCKPSSFYITPSLLLLWPFYTPELVSMDCVAA